MPPEPITHLEIAGPTGQAAPDPARLRSLARALLRLVREDRQRAEAERLLRGGDAPPVPPDGTAPASAGGEG
jgi:hypothetical protein